MRLLEPTAQIWIKIDPYYQRQQCRPMTLFSGNIRYMRIFAGVRPTLGGGLKWEWSWRRQFLAIWVVTWTYFFGNVRDKAIGIRWRYATPCLPVIDCKMSDLEWPRAGLFHVKIRFRIALPDSERLTFKNNCVKSNKHIPILHVRSGARGVPSKLG